MTMTHPAHPDLDARLRDLEDRLPPRLAAGLRWLRRPNSVYARVPVAGVLIVGGVLGFLPILGFWMIPLGLVLVAQDLPFLRRPLARAIGAVEQMWARWRASREPQA
jgi:hypothetical protein